MLKTKNKIFGIVGKTDGYLYRRDRVINIHMRTAVCAPLSSLSLWFGILVSSLLKKIKQNGKKILCSKTLKLKFLRWADLKSVENLNRRIYLKFTTIQV